MSQNRFSLKGVALPKHLQGLTEELLADVCDVVTKWGRDLAASGAVRLLSYVLEPHTINVTVMAGDQIAVRISPEEMFQHLSRTTHWSTPNDVLVWVDHSFTAEHLSQFVRAMDRRMQAHIDPSTGERLRVTTGEIYVPLMCVDRAFTGPDAHALFNEGTTPEAALARYDQPELLEVVDDAKSPCGFRVRRKRDGLREVAIGIAVERVQRRKGIYSREAAEALSEADKQAFCQAIDVEVEVVIDELMSVAEQMPRVIPLALSSRSPQGMLH